MNTPTPNQSNSAPNTAAAPASGSGSNAPKSVSGSINERIESTQALLQSAAKTSQRDQEWLNLANRVKSKRVMIVDDEATNIMMVRKYLSQAGYKNFSTCSDPREAVELATGNQPDTVLLDINMPHINGLELLRIFNDHPTLRNVPIIILTATTDPETKNAALELGANDFLTKPVDSSDLLPRVRNALMIKSHFDQLAMQKQQLEKLVKKRTEELLESRQQVILSLARAAEHRDNETGNHVIRVGYFAGLIAKQLGWNQNAIDMIQQAAQLHDVGKIGVPDDVLFKPGKLDQDEFELMKTHCGLGRDIIAPMSTEEARSLRTHTDIGASILGVQNSPLMTMAARIAQSHHEKWDGTGYPLGLAGTDIPIESRITSIADVFDALSSKRPYKEAFPRERCFEMMREMKGKNFDPNVLDAFFSCSKSIIEVQLAFMDR